MTKRMGEKQTADVRIKMRAGDKATFIAAAAADGYAEVSAWFRRLGHDRVAALHQEGKLPNRTGPHHSHNHDTRR